MEAPKYIKNVEINQGIFSITALPIIKNIDKFFDEKKIDVVYSSSSFTNKGIKFFEKIYKTKQKFYIYIEYGGEDDWRVSIFYQQFQENELIFFTKQLLKEIENGNHNTRP